MRDIRIIAISGSLRPIDVTGVSEQLRAMDRLKKAIFILVVVVTLVFAWTPHPPVLIAYDKAQHGLAFVMLALLGRIAFRRIPWQFLGLALAGLGALIEVVQAIPQLHRTCDIYDWYADVAAILLGLTVHASVSLWRSASAEARATQS